jgi:pimeloyl-ACP methyl ester carboxylesterase
MPKMIFSTSGVTWLALIPEAGHLSNLDQPAIFNSILLEHLHSL